MTDDVRPEAEPTPSADLEPAGPPPVPIPPTEPTPTADLEPAGPPPVPTPPAQPTPSADLEPAGSPPVPTLPVEPQQPFSLLALLALIAGVAAPVLACVGSVTFAIAARANEAMPLFVSIVLAVGLAGLPLAWQAWLRLKGRASPAWSASWRWVAAGSLAVVAGLIAAQVMVSLNILPTFAAAAAQPVIFVAASAAVLAAAGGAWAGFSRLRAWGHLLSGAWLSVLLSFIVEVFIFAVVGVVVLVVLSAVAPDEVRHIAALARSLRANPDERGIMELARQPWVIGLAYLVASVLIPLAEELLKPVGVMLFIGNKPAPMAAFMGGLMGGLGFAVTESLSNLANLQSPWFLLVTARLGTLAMHGFTSSLVGWGWGQMAAGRPGRLALAYLGAVGLHGLWNGAVVTIAFSSLYFVNNGNPSTPVAIGLGALVIVCGVILVSLVPACLVGLAWLGYRLRTRL